MKRKEKEILLFLKQANEMAEENGFDRLMSLNVLPFLKVEATKGDTLIPFFFIKQNKESFVLFLIDSVLLKQIESEREEILRIFEEHFEGTKNGVIKVVFILDKDFVGFNKEQLMQIFAPIFEKVILFSQNYFSLLKRIEKIQKKLFCFEGEDYEKQGAINIIVSFSIKKN